MDNFRNLTSDANSVSPLSENMQQGLGSDPISDLKELLGSSKPISDGTNDSTDSPSIRSDGANVISDKMRTDRSNLDTDDRQQELDFGNIWGPITRDIREEPLYPKSRGTSGMVLGIPAEDTILSSPMQEALNELTIQEMKDFLNPKLDPKPLAGPGGDLESIVSDGNVIQLPDDVIDCGFGKLEIPGAGRLEPKGQQPHPLNN